MAMPQGCCYWVLESVAVELRYLYQKALPVNSSISDYTRCRRCPSWGLQMSRPCLPRVCGSQLFPQVISGSVATSVSHRDCLGCARGT